MLEVGPHQSIEKIFGQNPGESEACSPCPAKAAWEISPDITAKVGTDERKKVSRWSLPMTMMASGFGLVQSLAEFPHRGNIGIELRGVFAWRPRE